MCWSIVECVTHWPNAKQLNSTQRRRRWRRRNRWCVKCARLHHSNKKWTKLKFCCCRCMPLLWLNFLVSGAFIKFQSRVVQSSIHNQHDGIHSIRGVRLLCVCAHAHVWHPTRKIIIAVNSHRSRRDSHKTEKQRKICCKHSTYRHDGANVNQWLYARTHARTHARDSISINWQASNLYIFGKSKFYRSIDRSADRGPSHVAFKHLFHYPLHPLLFHPPTPPFDGQPTWASIHNASVHNPHDEIIFRWLCCTD